MYILSYICIHPQTHTLIAYSDNTHTQIEQEVAGVLDFLKYVYDIFGFEYTFELSTRPEEKYLGTVEQWKKAEDVCMFGHMHVCTYVCASK